MRATERSSGWLTSRGFQRPFSSPSSPTKVNAPISCWEVLALKIRMGLMLRRNDKCSGEEGREGEGEESCDRGK